MTCFVVFIFPLCVFWDRRRKYNTLIFRLRLSQANRFPPMLHCHTVSMLFWLCFSFQWISASGWHWVLTWWDGEMFLAVSAHSELSWQSGMLLCESRESAYWFLAREKSWSGCVCVCVSNLNQKLKSDSKSYRTKVQKFNNLLFFSPFWICHNRKWAFL